MEGRIPGTNGTRFLIKLNDAEMDTEAQRSKLIGKRVVSQTKVRSRRESAVRGLRERVFVTCCCVTNNEKHSGLKQQ